MSRRFTTPALVLAALALAGLGVLLGWAVTRDHDRDMLRIGHAMTALAGQGSGEPVRDIEEAGVQAERFADRLGLGVGEVMEFSNGYYAELADDEGAPATEVLVDARSGAVWLEPGPAMMWNTSYGMMGPGGMMGGGAAGPGWMMGPGGMMDAGGPADPTWAPWGRQAGASEVAPAEARRIAARWLSANRSGLRAGAPEAFPGYYTLHTKRGATVEGMLSVNAYTGAVWYHWWHGRFVAMSA